MEPRINSTLHLVFPVRWSEEEKPQPVIWAYHTPLAREVFESNWKPISQASSEVFKDLRFAYTQGPLVAALSLRDACRDLAIEKGLFDPQVDPSAPLFAELRRLTMILAPSPQGYVTMPAEVAVNQKVIDAEEWGEIESAVVFFTCGSSMIKRNSRDQMRDALALVLRGSITSLPPMDFVGSLPSSTTAETSAEVAPAPTQAPIPQ